MISKILKNIFNLILSNENHLGNLKACKKENSRYKKKFNMQIKVIIFDIKLRENSKLINTKMEGKVEIKKYFLAPILIFSPIPQYIPPKKEIIVYPYTIIISSTLILSTLKLSKTIAITNGIKPLKPNILARFALVLSCLVFIFIKLFFHHLS